MFRRTALALTATALIALTVLATSGGIATARPMAHSPAASQVTRTTTSYVSPVTRAGALKPSYTIGSRHSHGQCEPGSDTGLNVYRCFSRNLVLDPCWVETGTSSAHHMLCLTRPWSHRAAQLTWKPSGDERLYSVRSSKALFGVRMADGKQCVAAEGAHDSFHGQDVNFYCNKNTELLGEPTMHQRVWHMREAINSKNFRHTTLGKRVAVAHGWYGRASISYGGVRAHS